MGELDREKLLVQFDVPDKRQVGVVVVQVAQVVAEEGVPAAAEGERPLELPAHRQRGTGALQGQGDRLGGVPAGAPQRGAG